MNFDSIKVGQRFKWEVEVGSTWNTELNGVILVAKEIGKFRITFYSVENVPAKYGGWGDHGYYLDRSEIESENCPIKRLEPVNYTYKQLLEKMNET